MDLDDAADELYALPPEEFVEARNALAKRVKSEGAADVAARIKALRKPTLAAWLTNQLVRQHADEIAALAELGERMRKAMSGMDGAALRELTGERKKQVDALLKAARTIAKDAGQKAGPDLVETIAGSLEAAIADPRAAEQLLAARLSHGLQHVGFGSVEDDGEPAEVISLTEARVARGQRLETTRRSRSAKGDEAAVEDEAEPEETEEEAGDGDGDEVAAAERELEQAETAVDDAEEQVDDAEAALDEQRRRLEEAQATAERLTEELAAARRELEQARDDVESAEDDVENARKASEAARRRRREAKQKLTRLS
ncbi:hypothetical protein [Jiangella mangrovi]|uniref:Putative RNase H-like nuclease (RuvC/YqgF family) n=1 Tax=Jiangella mangrovi TaxID=1524084 RepID=A0A7W9GPY1_9ACTN|nr:hypothetical protein [Jiangella mangrovi]MBB5787895.1 putative RNase H-like nuclease (RuvC/YqgF family) [Jiangella mangrovi]